MNDTSFVTKPVATALKEIGFDLECQNFYMTNNPPNEYYSMEDEEINWNKNFLTISAPTWTQASVWMDERYKICIALFPDKKATVHCDENPPRPNTFPNWESAFMKAIEIVKQKIK